MRVNHQATNLQLAPGAPQGFRLTGQQWVNAMRFVAATQSATLRRVIAQVAHAMRLFTAGKGPRPVVVFDLDDTLFRSNQARSWTILKEWMADRPLLHWNIRRALSTLRPDQLAYSIKDTFAAVAKLDLNNPTVKAAFADFESFWLQRFFSNAYCRLDPLERGAKEFVNLLHDMGANIAYLTGRDEPRMGAGTRQSIAQSGLPQPSARVRLFLKPNKDLDDAAFKTTVSAQLKAWGKVVGTFDNAPANCVVFADAFPYATNVFVNTVWSNSPVDLRHGLFKVVDFTRM